MRPRRQSADSETSSDSWSVIQKNVDHRELSNEEIEFVPSDSEHWNSDQDSEDYDSNEDDGNDSLEECAESLDEAGDCEVLNENEAMDVTGSRYYISSEKVVQSLDLLDAECCSTLGDVLRGVWPTSRDTTRAVVLLLFAVTTAIFFASSARLVDVDGPDRPPHEVFASGQQSRKDFEQAFMAVLRRRSLFNFSKTCYRRPQPQKPMWSSAPGWSSSLAQPTPKWSTPMPPTPRWSSPMRPMPRWSSPMRPTPMDRSSKIQPPTGLASFATSSNSSSAVEVNELSIFARPLTTGARISIARPLKSGRNVCSRQDSRHGGMSVAPRTTTTTSRVKRAEPVGPPRPSPPARLPAPSTRSAAPISISRMAKPIVVDDNVCVQNHKQRSASPFRRSVVVPRRKQSVKRLAGPQRPLIAFKKPVPCVVKPSIVYRKPTPRRFRPSIAFKKPVPCVGMPSIAFEKPLVPCMAGSPEIPRRTDVPPIECDRFARNVSVLLRRAPSEARRQKRAPLRPCVLSQHHRPCTDRNTTVKRHNGPKALLANIPTRQLTTTTTYQQRRPRRRPLAPSQPPLAQRPCEDRWDAVRCWKTLQQQVRHHPAVTSSTPAQFDWFTRRAQIRAENRRR